jgi:hypothetical protein
VRYPRQAVNKDTNGIANVSVVSIGTGSIVMMAEYAQPVQNAMHPLHPNGLGSWSNKNGNALSIMPDHISPIDAANNKGS